MVQGFSLLQLKMRHEEVPGLFPGQEVAALFSEMGMSRRSITASMSSHTLRFPADCLI